jgi:hypothetical protein
LFSVTYLVPAFKRKKKRKFAWTKINNEIRKPQQDHAKASSILQEPSIWPLPVLWRLIYFFLVAA